MLRMSSFTVHVFLSNYSGTRNSFINWTCRNFSHVFSSATCDSETVLGFGWFQNSFVRRSQTWYFHSIQIWGVIGWPFFLFQHLEIVLVEALWDTCNVRRAPCTSLNLPFRLAAVSCTLQWTSGAEINKQLQLLFATTLTLTLRHSDVIVV